MSFPNADHDHQRIFCPTCQQPRPTRVEQGRCGCGAKLVEPPIWRPVKGKPNVYAHDSQGCEHEIYRVECEECPGVYGLIYHALCACHGDGGGDMEARRKQHETCPNCGVLMTRLEIPKDGSWPLVRHEREARDETLRTQAEADAAEEESRRKLYDV